MANEISVTATLQYANPAPSINIPAVIKSLVGAAFNITGKNYVNQTMVTSTSFAAIPLGSLASLGWAMFINRDATNKITLKTASAGAVFADLLPGECALLRLASTITAPGALSAAGTPLLDYMILEI